VSALKIRRSIAKVRRLPLTFAPKNFPEADIDSPINS
jgi:hypothetical protein